MTHEVSEECSRYAFVAALSCFVFCRSLRLDKDCASSFGWGVIVWWTCCRSAALLAAAAGGSCLRR